MTSTFESHLPPSQRSENLSPIRHLGSQYWKLLSVDDNGIQTWECAAGMGGHLRKSTVNQERLFCEHCRVESPKPLLDGNNRVIGRVEHPRNRGKYRKRTLYCLWCGGFFKGKRGAKFHHQDEKPCRMKHHRAVIEARRLQ